MTANLLSGDIDEVFTRTDSSGTADFLTDALGSGFALTNSSGSILAQYAYEPFGNTTVTSGSSANSFEYTGRENDGTGLYFNRARYYSPTLQRFISEDPAGMLGGGPNLYAYVSNNPLSFVDPFGLDKKQPWCTASCWNRIAAGAGGLGNLTLGTAGFVAGLAGSEATGGLSLYLSYNSFGTAVSGGAQLWGAISGNMAGAQNVANYASGLSTLSGATTLAITGNPEEAATASDIETVATTAGLAGAASGGNLAKALTPDAGAYAGAIQSGLNLLGVAH